MTLTTRLSLFFLAALALVLAGFSTSLYVLAHTYLHRQAAERLDAALDTLVAAVENGPDGLEWERQERHLRLGEEPGPTAVRWLLQDDSGQLVDRSPNLEAVDFLREGAAAESPRSMSTATDDAGKSWLLGQCRIRAKHLPPSRPTEPNERKYAVLVVMAGLSLQPFETTLRNLAIVLTGLSLATWAVAAGVGRWLCRRALRPVTDMAATARTMGPADMDQRLPVAPTGDELEDLGRAFNELLTRRHEAFERQQRFTGDASHQLRTPLTALRGQIEVALRRDRSPEEYRQVLALVKEQAVQMGQIIDMLLFLARADAEAKLPHLEALDLAFWLPAYLHAWTGRERGKDIRLETANGGRFQVIAQAPLLGQLVDNLVDNACKYSAPGTPVRIRLTAEKGMVALTVEDQGEGIAAEDVPHVFEPFYRSPKARRLGHAGVGLGLAVAQRIATAFGGSLAAESREGHGSRFTLRLPAADPEPASAR